MKNFKNKKVLIFGLGLHGGGVAVAKWLAKQGARVSVVDQKSKLELQPSIDKLKNYKIKYFLEQDPDKTFLDYDFIIQNPGVPKEHPFLKIAKQKGIKLYNEAGLFIDLVGTDIIGITGSKGKSTTTSLLGSIFSLANKKTLVGGNIKINPMFSFIDKVKRDVPVVIELSSWHLENFPIIKQSPQMAIITNILPEHLNRYKNYSEYIQAKESILKYQKKSDICVLNYDNEKCQGIAKRAKSNIYWFSIKGLPNKNISGCFVKNNKIIFRQNKKEEILFDKKIIKLLGDHNLSNVLAATLAAKLENIPIKYIKKAISKFQGLENRMEFIRKVKGIEYWNDTTATAPVAAIAGIKTFDKKVILVAGGSDKNLPLQDLAKVIKNRAKYCLLFSGEGSARLLKLLDKNKYPQKNLRINIENMAELMYELKKILKSGDIVLLSPGFASFSTFANEFDRGDQFVKAVRKL